MRDEGLVDICIKALVLLSAIYKDEKIDRDTYTQHIKLKIKVLNDYLN